MNSADTPLTAEALRELLAAGRRYYCSCEPVYQETDEDPGYERVECEHQGPSEREALEKLSRLGSTAAARSTAPSTMPIS